jgi:hypothetical protein
MRLPGPMPYAPQVPYMAKAPKYIPTDKHTVQLHPLLRFTHSPVLNFDVTLSPSNISTYHQGLSASALSEPASKPPLPSLTVISPHLPWSINVAAPYGTFLTVFDVLDGIYRSLRANISSNDFRALRSQKDQDRVTVAFEQRCKRTREREAERRKGVRRVDFLMGNRKFTGLTSTNRGHDVWVLNTES